jgi:hypothetical protein
LTILDEEGEFRSLAVDPNDELKKPTPKVESKTTKGKTPAKNDRSSLRSRFDPKNKGGKSTSTEEEEKIDRFKQFCEWMKYPVGGPNETGKKSTARRGLSCLCGL